MTPHDVFLLAVPTLGPVFLYHVLTALPATIFGAPVLMRLAYPEQSTEKPEAHSPPLQP